MPFYVNGTPLIDRFGLVGLPETIDISSSGQIVNGNYHPIFLEIWCPLGIFFQKLLEGRLPLRGYLC